MQSLTFVNIPLRLQIIPEKLFSYCFELNCGLVEGWLKQGKLILAMQKSEAFIINRLIWKAGKYNLPGEFAHFFNDLPLSKQDFLNKQLTVAISGMPVLFFSKPTGEWTLVCTRQVICNDIKSVISLDINDIKRILPTAFDPTQIGQKIDISTIKKKSEWDTIQIIDKQDNSYILHADKGSDLFALWNILLMMVGLYS